MKTEDLHSGTSHPLPYPNTMGYEATDLLDGEA